MLKYYEDRILKFGFEVLLFRLILGNLPLLQTANVKRLYGSVSNYPRSVINKDIWKNWIDQSWPFWNEWIVIAKSITKTIKTIAKYYIKKEDLARRKIENVFIKMIWE